MAGEFPRLPPLSNRGVTKSLFASPPKIGIDWLSLTYVDNPTLRTAIDRLFYLICSKYVLGMSRKRDFRDGGKRHAFTAGKIFDMGGEAASIWWGNDSGFAMIDIHGAFCGRVDHKFWRLVSWFSRRVDARITRLDLAADFKCGEINIDQLRKMYERAPGGVLDIRGPVPRPGWLDRGAGKTLYFGSRQSAREICIYEKGYQLMGIKQIKIEEKQKAGIVVDSENVFPELDNVGDWVRVELRYRRQKNVFEIPYDLICPMHVKDHHAAQIRTWWGYISGLGPYFRKLMPDVEDQVIQYRKKQMEIDFNMLVLKQVKHVRDNYGKFLYFLTVLLPDATWLAPLLCNPEKPWPQLQRFKGWEKSPEVLETLSSSLLSMIPDYYKSEI